METRLEHRYNRLIIHYQSIMACESCKTYVDKDRSISSDLSNTFKMSYHHNNKCGHSNSNTNIATIRLVKILIEVSAC